MPAFTKRGLVYRTIDLYSAMYITYTCNFFLMQGIVEHAIMLLIKLVRCCKGLDSTDPELAWYVLDLQKLRLKNIIIVPDDPTCIVSFSSLSLPSKGHSITTPP